MESIPFQDRDLLSRLTQYLDNIDSHLSKGHGWLIFNADRERTRRIAGYLLDHFSQHEPEVRYRWVPWRDFSMHAYVLRVELVSQSAESLARTANPRLQQEYDIANRVTLDLDWQMRDEAVLLITGVAPKNSYETDHLAAIVDYRFTRHLATVVVTPRSIEGLASDFRTVGLPQEWDSLYSQMYETSFIAV